MSGASVKPREGLFSYELGYAHSDDQAGTERHAYRYPGELRLWVLQATLFNQMLYSLPE